MGDQVFGSGEEFTSYRNMVTKFMRHEINTKALPAFQSQPEEESHIFWTSPSDKASTNLLPF